MRGALFSGLLLLGCGGILLSFLHARSRAVFAQDGVTGGRRVAAIVLLAAVLLVTVALPFAIGFLGPDGRGTGKVSFVTLFGGHAILVVFLVLYYLLCRRRSILDFLLLRSERPGPDLAAGIAIGGGTWLLNLVLAALLVGAWYFATGGPPGGEGAGAPPRVSPLIVSLVAEPVAVRIGVVLAAMTVEELFFRSFLQTRVGPLASTLMFTAAHGAYGQPLLLLWILVISTVLSITLKLYRNVLPCIVAHGVFDAIQLFVVIPYVVRTLPM